MVPCAHVQEVKQLVLSLSRTQKSPYLEMYIVHTCLESQSVCFCWPSYPHPLTVPNMQGKHVHDIFSSGEAYVYTIFIRIVAVATINFSLAWVWLLIESGSYSRVAVINFGGIPYSAMHKNCSTDDWFMKKLLCCSRIKPRLSSTIVLPRTSRRVPLAIVTTPT